MSVDSPNAVVGRRCCGPLQPFDAVCTDLSNFNLSPVRQHNRPNYGPVEAVFEGEIGDLAIGCGSRLPFINDAIKLWVGDEWFFSLISDANMYTHKPDDLGCHHDDG